MCELPRGGWSVNGNQNRKMWMNACACACMFWLRGAYGLHDAWIAGCMSDFTEHNETRSTNLLRLERCMERRETNGTDEWMHGWIKLMITVNPFKHETMDGHTHACMHARTRTHTHTHTQRLKKVNQNGMQNVAKHRRTKNITTSISRGSWLVQCFMLTCSQLLCDSVCATRWNAVSSWQNNPPTAIVGIHAGIVLRTKDARFKETRQKGLVKKDRNPFKRPFRKDSNPDKK